MTGDVNGSNWKGSVNGNGAGIAGSVIRNDGSIRIAAGFCAFFVVFLGISSVVVVFSLSGNDPVKFIVGSIVSGSFITGGGSCFCSDCGNGSLLSVDGSSFSSLPGIGFSLISIGGHLFSSLTGKVSLVSLSGSLFSFIVSVTLVVSSSFSGNGSVTVVGGSLVSGKVLLVFPGNSICWCVPKITVVRWVKLATSKIKQIKTN